MSTDLLKEICFLAARKTIKCVFFMFNVSLLALSHATTLTISVLTWSIMASRPVANTFESSANKRRNNRF